MPTEQTMADSRVLVVDVRGFTAADLATVDALARLHLAARGVGLQLRLCGAPPDLLDVLALAGLDDVLFVI